MTPDRYVELIASCEVVDAYIESLERQEAVEAIVRALFPDRRI
jgi:hypothetical protein